GRPGRERVHRHAEDSAQATGDPAAGRVNVRDQIEALCDRRRALWSGAPESEPQEAEHIAIQLDTLYEARRAEVARERSGRTREDILASERIARQIDKLAGLESDPLGREDVLSGSTG